MATGSWDEYFGYRKWRVATEVEGTDTAMPGTEFNLDGEQPVQVRFRKGRFQIAGGVFHSPLSSARGTRGVLLQEVSPFSGDDITGSRTAVGIVVYRKACREGAVR